MTSCPELIPASLEWISARPAELNFIMWFWIGFGVAACVAFAAWIIWRNCDK